MKLTRDDIKVLSQWESAFNKIVTTHALRVCPSRADLQTIHAIWARVAKDNSRFNDSCSNCIYRLLHDIGVLYFKEKEEYLKVEMAELEAQKVKVEVKTRRKRNAVRSDK